MADNNGLPEIEASFEQALQRFPERKRELLKYVGSGALKAVRMHINRSIHDTHGRIQRGQTDAIGSKNGYVAICPVDEWDKGRHSMKAVTTFLNNGHIIRRKSGVPDGWCEARMFYPNSIHDVNRAAENAVKSLEEKLKNDLR